MRKALGTSIRTARHAMLKQQTYLQQRMDDHQNENNFDDEDSDEGIGDTSNEDTTFNSRSFLNDEAEADDPNQTEESDDGHVSSENELENSSINNLAIDELDEDSD